MTKKGLAQTNNVGWFQPKLSKLGVISGFVGFTQFNPPKPEVSFSGYSPKIARRHNWYFVTKIVLTYCEKKMVFSDRKKLEIRG